MASQSEPIQVSELLSAALGAVGGSALGDSVLGDSAVGAAGLGVDVGGPVEINDLRRLSGGASRETWSFNALGRPLILRRDPPGRPSPVGVMRNEAQVIRACHRAGLAVPEVLLFNEGEQLGTAGIVMSAVKGETIPRRILRDDEFETARSLLCGQVAEFMAGLHSIDPHEVPGVSETDELTNYRVGYSMLSDRSAVFERAFDWLESTRLAPGRLSVVHGDLRMGNIIVDADGLGAVIDWELMHLGDPIEDLAWFCVKAWRFGSPLGAGGVGEIEYFLSVYEQASGAEVDRDRFHWWLVQKTLTWGVIAMGQAFAHLSGAVRSHELAAIGRRVAEQEWDLIELLAPQSAAGALAASPLGIEPEVVLGEADDDPGVFGRPTAREILVAVRDFLDNDVVAQTEGRLSYNIRVAAKMLAIVERQIAAVDSGFVDALVQDPDSLGQEKVAATDESAVTGLTNVADDSWDRLARSTLVKLSVANPRYVLPG